MAEPKKVASCSPPLTRTDQPPTMLASGPQAGILEASDPTEAPLQNFGQDDDADSSLGDDVASSTASLTESILEYRALNGRTYHSEIGKAQSWCYRTPNDNQQTEAMDLLHHVCTLMLDGKLFLAPIKPDIQLIAVETVVDIGTGTGIWAIDVADQFPGAKISGTDLSPIQPAWVPLNCVFEIDDANGTWTWRDNTFDFVHMRALLGCIEDWAGLYKQAFRVCKPDGWFEHYEMSIKIDCDDDTVEIGSPMERWGNVFWEGGKEIGRTFRVVEDGLQKKGMEEAGFVDVEVRDFKCPFGAWPRDTKMKEIGKFAKVQMESDIKGFIVYMWREVMKWSETELEVYLAGLRTQLRDKTIHPWYLHRVVYGRKP